LGAACRLQTSRAGIAADASGRAWQRDDQWFFTTIKHGGQATAAPGDTSTMPAFGSLTDADIWAVLSYIKSTWPKDIQDAQPR
jgi:mono/diheme cytochrome c family protein